MSVGGGKSSARGSQTATPDPELAAFTQQLRKQAEPVGDILSQQIQEALKTGGIGAYLPIAQASVEQSRAATSSTLQQVQDNLVKMGLDKTPFGANILAGVKEQGSLSAEQIYPNIASALISAAPGFATGTGGLVVNALRPFGTTERSQSGTTNNWGFDLGGASSGAAGAGVAALFAT